MIRLIKSTFYKEKEVKKKLASFILNSKILSFNKECEKFEKRFAKFQGRKHCIFVNSGSSANLALIQSLLNLGKLKKDDRVGFSALTWSTNVMPLIQLGLKPVPIDIELDTLNVSSNELNKVLKTKKIKALFLTNVLGFCDDIDNIAKICKENNIVLVEDNCESLGTQFKGKKLGNYGFASTFSFYVGHHMSTIEGGAICTDNDDFATMLKIVRAHGWDRNLSFLNQNAMREKFKINSTFYSRYTFYDLGFNLRPTEISGYIGNLQLSYIKEIIKKRNFNFMKVYKTISNNNKYLPLRINHIDFLSSFAIPIICKTKKIKEDLVKKCKNIVEIRPIIGGNITRQPFYLKYNNKTSSLNANIAHEQGLYIGNNPELTDKELDKIINILK